MTGADIVLKLENLQHTGSFKVRGALVKLESLDKVSRAAGVVAVSAGNHAQGVAFHAARLGIPATIVMPRGTPFTKVGRTKALGARVLLEGEELAQARAFADGLMEREGLCFISPFDDEHVIAGQGTIALEMLADDADLDCLVIPIGGGGLIAGMAVAARAARPDIEIIGVEAELYPSTFLATGRTHGGAGCRKPGGQTLAEGIAVKQPGRLTLPIIERLVNDIVLVSEIALENAVNAFLDRQRLVVEGAGAASLAAVLSDRARFAGRKVGLVVSGGNIDSMVLSAVLLRGIAREGRLARLRVEIPDTPGLLARVSAVIGQEGGNIVEVYHSRHFYDVPLKLAELDVVVETQGPDHVCHLVEKLKRAGFPARLLSGTSAGNDG